MPLKAMSVFSNRRLDWLHEENTETCAFCDDPAEYAGYTTAGTIEYRQCSSCFARYRDGGSADCGLHAQRD